MEIVKMQRKVRKETCYKQVPNNNGLNIWLNGAHNMVGFFVVTKELKHHYWGHFGRCTHEEYKAGKLQELTMDFLDWPERLPPEVEALVNA